MNAEHPTSTIGYQVKEAFRRMNLERSDIAALKSDGVLACKVEDVRYWRDTIIRLQNALKDAVG